MLRDYAVKRTLFLFLIFLAIPVLALEQFSSPIGKIVSYGIYSRPVEGGSSWSNAAATNHKIGEGGESSLEKQTSEIPIIKDIYFAFTYEIIGLPEGAVLLDWTVQHPKMVKPDGTKSSGYTYRRPVFVKNGIARGISGYGLNEPYEMVPGEWVFTYSYRGKAVVSQRFVTIAP
jgi:hypothetical protein